MTHHFGRNHYEGTGIDVAAGENWSKIFGPFLLYLNSGQPGDGLWADAKRQAAVEQAAWPYAWLTGVPEYPAESERGTVTGSFRLTDTLKPGQTSAGAWIGLTQPPAGLDFQTESKNYQYWSRVKADGSYTIPHVRPGTYTLYAFVDGEVGQYKQEGVVVSGAGKTDELKEMVWAVPRSGGWLAWEIGRPDRDTLEFRHGSNYFQPYLYKGFAMEWPNPLVYKVGMSTPTKDWNYAQSNYHKANAAPEPWRWQIQFKLPEGMAAGEAHLILALAGSNKARVEISVNGGEPVASFRPELDGGNALLRQGSHAKSTVKEIAIPMAKLHAGDNVIELVQADYKDDASYVSYDYVALEMPGERPAQ